MKRLSRFIYRYFLIFIVVISVAIHFLWVDKFPVAMSHDELIYILSSKTYALFGTDVSGIGFPLSIFKTKTEGVISFLPPLILSPLFILLPLNHLSARIPYIILNLATAWAFFLLLEHFVNRKMATIGTILFLINPWSFYLSRQTTDVAFALFFYLAGIGSVLRLKKYSLMTALIFFMLGFFSYHGAKVIFLPLVVLTILYKNNGKIPRLRETLAWGIIAAFIVVGGYFLIDKSISGSIITERANHLIINSDIGGIVNDIRKGSIENPLKAVFSNKFIALLNIFFEKYMTAFSPDVLFVNGDSRAAYRFGEHGLFYKIDLIFLLIGSYILIHKNKKLLVYLLLILIISPLATAVSSVDTSVVNRSFMQLPTMLIVISIGLVGLSDFLKNKIGIIKSTTLMTGIVTLFALNFFYFYFFRFPIRSQENYFLSERIVSVYSLYDLSRRVTVTTPNPRVSYMNTIFYSKILTQDKLLKETFPGYLQGRYQVQNVTYTDSCLGAAGADQTYLIYTSIDCPNINQPKYSIVNQKDGGEIFNIYNDALCHEEDVPRWRRFHFLSDYNLDDMSKSEFCQRWITQSESI